MGRGLPLCHAARAAGISNSHLCKWRLEDERFALRIESAVSKAIEKRLRKIEQAANAGDWRAAECWLRLVLPAEYGRNRLEVTGADGSPLAGMVAICLPPKQDDNGNALPAVTVPALEERNNGSGN